MRYNSLRLFCIGFILLAVAACSQSTEPYWGATLPRQLNHTYPFPQPAQTQHFAVLDGKFLMAFSNALGTRSYTLHPEYTLAKRGPYTSTVYTRALLDNPRAQANPLVYDNTLTPEETTKFIAFPPVEGFTSGHEYKLTLEFYNDATRTSLLERLEIPFAVNLETFKAME